jgi:rRNA maturation endonuclease Nob1
MAKTRRKEIDCEACYNRTAILFTEDPPAFCPVCGEKAEELYGYSEELDFED